MQPAGSGCVYHRRPSISSRGAWQALARTQESLVRKCLFAAALFAALPVYLTPSAAVTLSANDPKFDTPKCRMARADQKKYAEKAGNGRFFTQFAWWGIGGFIVPPGTYDPTKEQVAINHALERYCVSRPQRR
jgi:hypothetical protein